jgi:hypothetical protein
LVLEQNLTLRQYLAYKLRPLPHHRVHIASHKTSPSDQKIAGWL